MALLTIPSSALIAGVGGRANGICVLQLDCSAATLHILGQEENLCGASAKQMKPENLVIKSCCRKHLQNSDPFDDELEASLHFSSSVGLL